MSKKDLRKEKPIIINKETVLAIMGKLSYRQRSVLSLRHFEKMSWAHIAYIQKAGYLRVFWYLLGSHMKLKLLLMLYGHRNVSLKRFLVRFQNLSKTG